MKKLLLIIFALVAYSGYAQTVLYKSDSVLITTTRITYPGGIIPFVIDTTGKTGYTDFTSLENISQYGTYSGDFKWIRNTLITDYVANWGSLNITDRRALVRYNVYPNGTPIAELGACYTLSERNEFRDNSVEALKYCDCIIMKGGADKYFYQTVDINGVIETTEITTYQTIND